MMARLFAARRSNLRKRAKQELEVNESEADERDPEKRIIYWSAIRGNIKVVRHALKVMGFSPATRCFQLRNLFTAAVIGK